MQISFSPAGDVNVQLDDRETESILRAILQEILPTVLKEHEKAALSDILDPKQAAKVLGISVAALNKRRQRGQIPAVKQPGAKGYFYHKQQILDDLAVCPAVPPDT